MSICRITISLAFFVVLAVLPGQFLGQAPKLEFKHITNEQGLSNTTIEAIFQDKRGFMWFGTRDGLNRYDGSQLVVYRYNSTDSNSISDNFIQYIYEDRQQQLWVGTINGLNKFDPATNRFTRYKHRPADNSSLGYNHVTSILEDKKGNVWISTLGGGISRYNKSTNNFTRYRHQEGNPGSLVSDEVYCLFRDSQDNYWVGTKKGLQLFYPESGRFELVERLGDFDASREKINIIKEDRKGNLWLGTDDNGLIYFDHKHNLATRYQHQQTNPLSLANNLVRAILADKNDNTWIGSINGGLNLFNESTNSFFLYQNEPNDLFSLSQRTVSALFEDNQGNIWVGTHRGGVNLYMPNKGKFNIYRQEARVNSLSHNDVKAFYEDRDGTMWIGTDGGGLNRFDRKTNSFQHYKYDPFNPASIGSNEVQDITEDSEGNFWVATWGGGLCSFNKKTGSFTRYTNRPTETTSISSNYIQAIFEDSRKNLWIATYYGGINLFDRATKKFTRLINAPDGKSKLEGNNIVSIAEDQNGHIWMGSDDAGLNCYNIATGSFSHFFNGDEKKPDLRVLFVDSRGRLWVGQTGLYIFDPAKKSFSLFTEKGGLSTEFIKGMAEDGQGNFWISTSNGITWLDPVTTSTKKFNTADGLQGLEYEANAYLKTSDGEVFFGGVNGFNNFYPKNIRTNNFIPPVYITDFQVFNKRVVPGEKDSPLQQDISFTHEIELAYNQATFSFNFASLNFTASENNQFAYKLENWDQDWNYSGTDRKASYTNVSPGKYIFHVKASNNDGIWNETGYAVTIIIHPPFWATWWFRLLVLLALSAGMYKLYRFRRNLAEQKMEERKREEMHEVQLQFFTNISHEFRTPLSLILGPIEKLQQEDNRPSFQQPYNVIQRNARRLLNLINELMDFRKLESGALKLNVMPGNLNLFLHEIAEDFSQLALEKNIRFIVEAPESTGDTWFDRQVLEKIITNLLSNAFKYTSENGQVSLQAHASMEEIVPAFENSLAIKNDRRGQRYFYLGITDNGIGISKESISHLFERFYKISESHLGSGIGLAFVKSLTTLHKGDIAVYSERNKGTQIIIGIPVGKGDYSASERWMQNKEEQRIMLQTIPVVESPYQPAPIEKTADKIQSDIPLSHPHLLIVDDNAELRNFLKESLSHGFTISEAVDGKEGFEKAKNESPDIIISDIMMPVINGVEFCKMIKEDIETSHIPFIMLTAKGALESNLEGIASGADFYFSKPLSMQLLEGTIKNILLQKQKLKERYLRDQHAEAKELVHTVKDKAFMAELLAAIEKHLTNPDMDVDYLCVQMGMSRTKLYTKIKNITGQSINDFIRTIRLKKAVQLMTTEDISLIEVMYNVGIQTQSYFTKAFKKEFGKTPSQFLKELNK